MKFLLRSFLFLFAFSTNAQSHSYVRFDYTKSSSILGNIRSIAYDESGFLWVAGLASEVSWGKFIDRGSVLQRFDGNTFHDIPVPYFGLDIEHISQISEIENGNFYLRCVSKDGVMILNLNPKTVKFEAVIFPKSFKKGALNFSNIFLFGSHSYILVKSNGQIILYEMNGSKAQKVTKIKEPKKLPVNLATDFISYEEGFLVSYISNGIYFYNWEGEIVKTPEQLLTDVSIRSSAWIDGKWNFNGKDVFLLDKNPILYSFSIENKKIYKLFDFSSKIGKNDFWFWNDGKGRLLLLISEGQNLELYELTAQGLVFKNTIYSQNISKKCIVYSEDITRDLWIGNPAYELNYYWYLPKKVQRFLTNKSIRSLYPLSKNNFLVSTEFSGWFELNLKENAVKPFQTYLGKEEFPLNFTRNIISSKDSSEVWTNYRYGIALVNLKTHQVEKWEGLVAESLQRWDDNTLVYGTMGQGLMAFDLKEKKHTRLVSSDSLWIMSLAVDSEQIFAGTDKGLLVYDGKSKDVHFYTPSKEADDNYFLSLLKEQNSTLLLGAKSGKLFRFDPKTKKFELIYEDKLKAPIASLVHYQGKLWINTFEGIVALNMENGDTNRYSTLNGFSSNEANRYSTLTTKKGLFIGTVNGLNLFRPQEISLYQSSCNLLPLSMTYYDEKEEDIISITNRERMENGSKIILPANNRFFQLNFGIGSCNFIKNLKFEYRLNDNPWKALKNERQIRFESLAPGTYELEVAAFNYVGEEVGIPLKFTIEAKEFFIQTLAFKIVLFLLLGVFITIYYINQIRKIKKEQILRTSISSDLHDEVGGLLTAISMRAEILGSADLTESKKKEFIKSIATSCKEAVKAMRDVVWSIDARKDDWESLLSRLREYGNQLFDDSKTDFTIEQKGILPKSLSQKLRHEVYLICKEALTNSAKHSSAKSVTLVFEFSRQRVKIVISDNGNGIKTKGGPGQGIKNIRMRAEKIGAGLYISSYNNGTSITLTF